MLSERKNSIAKTTFFAISGFFVVFSVTQLYQYDIGGFCISLGVALMFLSLTDRTEMLFEEILLREVCSKVSKGQEGTLGIWISEKFGFLLLLSGIVIDLFDLLPYGS